MKIYHSFSSDETKKFGVELVKKLLRDKRHVNKKQALVLALKGDLGAGKTTFAQGFLRGLGVKKRASSPTFVLVKGYKLKVKGYSRVYHIDVYRLGKPKEILDLGLREILNNPKNIVLIEWAEKLKRYLPKDIVWVKFNHKKRAEEREISVI